MERRQAWSHLPLGLLGMALLVLAVESSIRFRLDAISDWMSFTWRYASQSIREPASRADVVFLGDSLMKGGVLPALFDSKSGTASYNLSIQGGTAPSSYFLLKRLLDSGGRPRLVVVDFHPNLLAIAPRSTEYWADLLSVPELADLCWQASDPALFAKTALHQMFPSYRHRTQVRAAVIASFRGEAGYAKRFNDLLRINYQRNGGARLMPVQDQVVTIDPQFKFESHHRAWSPHRTNVVYVRRLLKLAEASEIVVAWLLPPTSPDWLNRRRSMNAEAPHDAFVKAIQSEFPSLVVIDGREAGYPNSAFRDLTHLHAQGASELSLGLASLLNPLLKKSPPGIHRSSHQWLRPPSYQGSPIDPDLVIFDETQVALRPAGAARSR